MSLPFVGNNLIVFNNCVPVSFFKESSMLQNDSQIKRTTEKPTKMSVGRC